MANVFSFDTARLETILIEKGLRGTWRSLLATLIGSHNPEFRYILDSAFIANAEPLQNNMLNDLTIGQIGVLYEFCVAIQDASARKRNGQFFTPDDVSGLMVKEALDFPVGRWLDPCSGIGNLSWHLVNQQADKEDFLINRMVLSDKDSLALEIARVLFTLSFQNQHKDLYHRIEASFRVFDFLSVADKGDASLFGSGQLSAVPSHDFVIVNPPYLGLKTEDSRFESSKAKDLYAYFLENIIKTSEGFVSVTPQSFTNAGKFRPIRRLLMAKFPTIKIYAFDNIPGNIFYGVKFGSTNTNSANSIRAAIMVAKNSEKSRRITSLLRWKTSERSVMFKRLDEFLTEAPLSLDFFPKVSSVFLSLFNEMHKLPRLESLLSKTKTEFVLYVPTAPRYFISALKTSVSRASMKTLFFRSETDLNVAYLLLNSSLMYWWWRVRDGGMTLSLETIKSAPIPEFEVVQELVDSLLVSENTNKVYKRNAGAIQENIKHDMVLVARLNRHLVPVYSERLILTHSNSELQQLANSK